ncbi:TPA: hypothetical protein SL665_001648 [Pseudomonas aeruginosa]|uniref:hypothetical protein n=1 Tax=Pseudomonas aeruginosa TaxID=287 RepID=UPI000495B6D1|nr:hypothetical protein [Pseudomonas aeruginosa]ALY46388.1 hypothetical protein HW08_03160 [Pseudomonas aeruginosa]EMB9966803.1 hypothetical protein [Pseudomonas aeruginosa]MBG4989673.1 hypothetical protein [Pseudomonas aeruginosa]MBG5085827.1 hypothetical protein [Pseudomonas aeruginosa]MBG6396791.1 hypothetical protein [Pseudomonas aeruginosa]
MNDRELLELAARAAGIKARWFRVNQWRQVGGNRMQTGQEDVFGTHHRKPWNPLTDDGDALRLAVLLNLEIHSPKSNPTVMFRTAENDVFYQDTCIRLAIVRAAAEIGKSMGGGNE